MNEFEVKCKEIEKEIFAIKSENSNIKPIADGIVNIEKYLHAKYKILWILKESNDVRNGVGGGWGSVNKALDELDCWANQPKAGRITFQRMIYASYGILNDFILRKDPPNISHSQVFEVIKEIAYINVKKLPGGSSANEALIRKAYNNDKDLLLKQINTYNPDIIIAGNTLQHFFNDLPIKMENKKYVNVNTKNTVYYPDKERLYIHAWHPAYFVVNEEIYCNEIILAVKDWVENRKTFN